MGTAMREVFGRVLQDMAEDERLVVLDADLGSATKTLMFRDVCPERFIDVGIAEQDLIGTAVGLASCGMIPVAATFSVFLAGRALDQIRNSVAYPKLNVKLVGTHAGVSVGYDGASHEAVEDIAVMRALPNMTVLCTQRFPMTVPSTCGSAALARQTTMRRTMNSSSAGARSLRTAATVRSSRRVSWSNRQ